ncbi:alpha/beta hydrolase [Streptomyces sp. ODS28]|uniref:alpha/beta fold hydrolase n=1 Tax=Streptomyces sp. ODS28 TaxID=3136688 RepID=UPI0031E593E2
MSLDAIQHRHLDVNGVRLHLAECGPEGGPLVVLLHGFPESWYSWRHQFGPLAEAGYRVVAPDQRGYARSDQPEDIPAYTMMQLTGDVIGLIHGLGRESAVVVGHDWGAPVAWHTAMFRPDVVRGVAGLSVPPPGRGGTPPTQLMRQAAGDDFYVLRFQEPGVADAELARDLGTTFRKLLVGASGDSPFTDPPRPWIAPEGGGVLDAIPDPDKLPGWLSEEDIAAFVADYGTHGERAFTGGLNWYRNFDRNWEQTPWLEGRRVDVPALYVVGDRDLSTAYGGVDKVIAGAHELASDLRHSVLPGCGHWTQQERPEEVNAELLGFLRRVSEEG